MNALLVATGPGDETETGSMMFFSAIAGAKKRVWIASPYFVPDIDIMSALKHAARMERTRRADWILPLDIDEFVNIHTGDGTLADLHAALPEATAITLTWRLFGNNDQVRFIDAPVTESVIERGRSRDEVPTNTS